MVPRGISGFTLAILEGGEEAFAGELPINELGAGVLDSNRHIGGQMAEGDSGGNLVDVLAAWAGGAAENFLQLGVVQMGDGFHRINAGLTTSRRRRRHLAWSCQARLSLFKQPRA